VSEILGTAANSWLRDIGSRLRRLTLLKAVGTAVFIWLFFVAYFHIQDMTANRASTMPLTFIDKLIGFQPVAFYPYASLWLYISLVPAIMPNLRALIAYGLWIAALCLTGLACFWFWPTAVPPLPIDTSSYPGFSLIHSIDAPGNACPSLHVACAVFTAIWLNQLLAEIGTARWLRAINWLWCIAIAWSTVATRQHVTLDVLAGCALGTAFALTSLWRRPAR
jgi:membrane-associated phospholipid phosphatase